MLQFKEVPKMYVNVRKIMTPKINKMNYNKMGDIKLFDVTLRDGLQTNNKIMSIEEKYDLYRRILRNYNPHSVEIGSIVNKNILPQMANTIDFFKYINKKRETECTDQEPKLYVLTPNIRGLKEALSNKFEYLNMISSVSDSFQIKNTRKNLLETKVQIKEMINLIKETNNGCDKKIKLYLSCIDHCPIDGKVNSETIIQEILHYYSFYDNEIDDICLSDTCGNLTISSFREIMETLINVVRMNTSKI